MTDNNKNKVTNIKTASRTRQQKHLNYNEEVNSNFWPFAKTGAKGEIVGGIGHVDNLRWMLDQYGIVIRYNVITKEQELNTPNRQGAQLLDNSKGEKLELVRSLCELNKMPTTRVQEQLSSIANSLPYNPVVEYAESKPWDGVDRLAAVLNTVIVDDSIIKLKDAYIRKWLIAAACLAENDDERAFSMKGVLVFQGIQGIGKTPWGRILLGDLSKLFLEGHILNPDNKDSVITSSKYFVVELGELDATTSKSGIASLKAHIPKSMDTIRLPYASEVSTLPRRTIYFGTVNPASFLVDNTGNDRFWAIPVTSLDLDALDKIDKQQLWAQAFQWARAEVKRGVRQPWALSDEDKILQATVNEGFRSSTTIEAAIMDTFEALIESNEPRQWVASTLDICYLAGFDKSRVNAKDKSSAEAVIIKLFGKKTKYEGKRGWTIPQPRRAVAQSEMETLGMSKRSKPIN